MTTSPDAIKEFGTTLATYHDLSPDEVRAAAAHLWPTMAMPTWRFQGDQLLALDRFLWFTTDGPERPIEPVTPWRGQLLSDEPSGISWSADHAVAHFYATQYSKDLHTLCITAEVPRRAELARFNLDGEGEVIVDPSVPFVSELHCRLPCLKHPERLTPDRLEWMTRKAESTNGHSRH